MSTVHFSVCDAKGVSTLEFDVESPKVIMTYCRLSAAVDRAACPFIKIGSQCLCKLADLVQSEYWKSWGVEGIDSLSTSIDQPGD